MPAPAQIEEPLQPLLLKHLDILIDPVRGGPLLARDGELVSVATGDRVPSNAGIPNLYADQDQDTNTPVDEVSRKVREFYEETPFPNYDEMDSRQSLQAKAKRSVFARLLDEQLPDRALVWEAGCGTAQLSNFLGLSWRRHVIAGDICLNSLRLGKDFADRNVIRNVAFVQMNLFRPPFRDEAFDVVISNGVLHHTADCEGAFRSILTKLKPGGHVLVGLYNYYGRLPTLWTRRALEKFGKSAHFLDHRLKELELNPRRGRAWYMDQYRHPFETRHSMDEVLQWFDRYGVDFVNGIPHIDGSNFGGDESLFEPRGRGSVLSRVGTQIDMLLGGGKDGGLFIMIGKKRSAPAR